MKKREFLKLMGGLSLGLIPIIGCYDNKKQGKQTIKDNTTTQNEHSEVTEKEYKVTEQDVILLQKNDAAFAQNAALYNKRITKIPKYIAVCKTNLGIQYAIQLAKKENLPIAIRSGGHSFEGFSSNDGGMMIHLGNMKKIKWNEDGSITIQAGVLLRELHEQVYAKGKLIPAGSCGGVGIAGLTLGGGYGFFSRKFGLTSDNLVNATLITADEKIIQAKEDADLLWALKGGGNGNFGVVSDFTFKTYTAPKNFSAYTLKFRNLNATRFVGLLENWMNASKRLPEEAFGAFVLNGSTLTVLFTTYNAAPIHSHIQGLIDQADSSNESLNKDFVPALKRFYGRKDPLYFKNASCGYYNHFSELETMASTIFEKVNQHKGLIFQLNTLGGAINKIEKNASAYPHRDQFFLSELQAYYDNKSQESKLVQAFESIQDLVYENGIKTQYANYPDLHFKNWEQAYYGENYKFLQTIKKKWDPENFFRHEQSIQVQ